MAPKTFGERCHPTDFGSHRHISTYKPKTTRRQTIKEIDEIKRLQRNQIFFLFL